MGEVPRRKGKEVGLPRLPFPVLTPHTQSSGRWRTKGARPAGGGACRSRRKRGAAPPSHAASWAFGAGSPPPTSRAVCPGLASRSPSAGQDREVSERGRGRRSSVAATAGPPARLSPLGTASGASAAPCSAGLPRRVGGRRCGEVERWESQAGQSPVSDRRDRPRPWESLATQTEGK